MSVAGNLYQEVILDHSRSPRNHRKLDPATNHAHGDNPLCGDEVTVYLVVDEGVVREVAFEGRGCAISKASASIMTTAVKGKRLEEVARLFEEFLALVKGRSGARLEDLGKLAVFAGVSDYPARVKCASLAWHTLQAALERRGGTVTTEKG